MKQAKPTYAGWLPLHSATSMIFSSVSPTQAVGFVTGFCYWPSVKEPRCIMLMGRTALRTSMCGLLQGLARRVFSASRPRTARLRALALRPLITLIGTRVDASAFSVDRSMFGVAAVRRYLAAGLRGSSPWYLAQRPIIAIYPDLILGRRIWSPAK